MYLFLYKGTHKLLVNQTAHITCISIQLHCKRKLGSTPTNTVIKSRGEERVSQNLTIEKLFRTAPFVVTLIVENT